MHTLSSRAQRRAPIALAAFAGALLLLAIGAGTAAAADTRSVQLRVEGREGTLEPGRGYVAGTVRARRAVGTGCNPHDARRRFAGPTPLGALGLAGQHNDRLRPQWIRPTDFGWQLCGIGSELGFGTFPGDFGGWIYRVNNEPGQAAIDETTVRLGDKVLLYYAIFPGEGSATQPLNNGRELVLRRVPARVRPGEPFEVRVVAFDFDPASPEPGGGSEGIRVQGAGAPVVPDASGVATVTIDEPGTSRLLAVDTQPGPDGFGGQQIDIASQRLEVCVRAKLSSCPAERGTRFLGSPGADRIRATRGDDLIRAGAGNDVVDLRPGGRNRVFCGGGRDTVIVKRGERGKNTLRGCQRVVTR